MRISPELEKRLAQHLAAPREPVDWLLEGLAVLAITMPAAYLLAVWSNLPASVPTHFDFAGRADSFGPRGSLWGPVGVQLGLYLLFTLLRRLPPRYWNLPFEATEANVESVAVYMRRFMAGMKAVICLVFGLLLAANVRVALGRAGGLAPWLALASVGALFAVVLWLVVAGMRLNRA